MDILFLLVPLSVLLALGVVGLLAWAVWTGQFEDIESEGQRIMLDSGDLYSRSDKTDTTDKTDRTDRTDTTDKRR